MTKGDQKLWPSLFAVFVKLMGSNLRKEGVNKQEEGRPRVKNHGNYTRDHN